jgi:hypothetical protein
MRAQQHRSSHGDAEHRLRLATGWFNETLTEEMRGSLALQKARLIMIDCDDHTPSRLALPFACRSLVEEAAIFFDDWGWTGADQIAGQKEKFASFLRENPRLRPIELASYRPEVKVFHVINTSIQAGKTPCPVGQSSAPPGRSERKGRQSS